MVRRVKPPDGDAHHQQRKGEHDKDCSHPSRASLVGPDSDAQIFASDTKGGLVAPIMIIYTCSVLLAGQIADGKGLVIDIEGLHSGPPGGNYIV